MSKIECGHEVLRLYHVALVEDLLGPGLRLVFWLSGCDFRCPGCIDPAQWDRGAGKPVAVSDLAEACAGSYNDVEGVTFSGGEPLLQAVGLLSFLRFLPPKMDKMLFTGFEQEEMSGLQREVQAVMDISVEGRYIEKEAGDYLWRGSANKILRSPTCKYDQATLERWMHSPSAGMSVNLAGESVLFYGVPRKGALESIEKELRKKGVFLDFPR